MNYYLDRIIRFAALRVAKKPKGMEVMPPKGRKKNIWQRGDKVLVSKVNANGNVREAVEKSVELLGGLENFVQTGETVMIKPNFNRSNPPPASTSLDFLEAIVVVLQEKGVKVVVGECSGPPFITRKILELRGVQKLLHRLEAELIIFNEGEWLEVHLGGEYLEKITMPKCVYEVDKMIYLSNMKTHRKARFSLSLKLAVGFTHPCERRMLHDGDLEKKVAEINLAWQPDLIVMDGRKAFVTGGPDDGKVVEPGVIMASGDMVAIDMEALKMLMDYKADNRLDMTPNQFPQIKVALARELGKENYTVIK